MNHVYAKYIKYKNKYINLKNKQTGGNLLAVDNFNFNDKVNLAHNKFLSNFSQYEDSILYPLSNSAIVYHFNFKTMIMTDLSTLKTYKLYF